MATFQHPASLNVLQQFGQARSILRNTTRATNPAWYQDALELNFQFHIRSAGAEISSFYFDKRKNQWSPGPTLSDSILQDAPKLDAVIAEVLRQSRAAGSNALGVVIHIADEFATTELKPELDNPASLPDLKEAAYNDPASIIEDSSIQADQFSWRVIPYPAAGSQAIGTTITLSRQCASLISAFRQTGELANYPVITAALSAPLVAVMGLSRNLSPSPGKPFVAILQYPWFTTLAFFNEHHDLRLIRTLQHRGVRRATNFRNALSTTNASLEFVDPDLFLIPLGADIDTTLEANLKITFTTSRVEVVHLAQSDAIPSWSPEPLIASDTSPLPESALNSHSFTILRDEKWALQDFVPTPKEVIEIYPKRAEMRLLRALRLARVALVAVTILCLAYFTFGVIDIVRRPEWAFDPNQATVIESRLNAMSSERKKADHWNNLLDDRSKTWIAMEDLSRMVTENGGMLVKGYTYAVKPEPSPGTSKVGFIKEWRITGFARDEALEYLNDLNSREGINAHFKQVATATGNSSYDPSIGNRNITVNVRTQENGTFKPIPPEEASPTEESTYPFTFDLSITQRFEATDPLAINVPKTP